MAETVAFTMIDPYMPQAIGRATSSGDVDKLEGEIAARIVVDQRASRGARLAEHTFVGFTAIMDKPVWPDSIGPTVIVEQVTPAAVEAIHQPRNPHMETIARATKAVHGRMPIKTVATKAAPEAALSIDAAMREVQGKFIERLEAAGLDREIVLGILELVNLTAEAKVVQQQLAAKRDELAVVEGVKASPGGRVIASDPMEPLSASELGERLGLHEQTVRAREREGKLFSILREGRKRGQEFPAFQAMAGMAGKPLEDTLAALVPAGQAHPVSGPEAYGFLTSPTDLLAGLSPVEVLLGRQLSSRALDTHAAAVLKDTCEARLQLVVETARAMAGSENA
jgi:hypothetical protein